MLKPYCTLCNDQTDFFYESNQRHYYQCKNCSSIMLAPKHFISLEEERKRYRKHNNCVDDPRYQKFVSPIADEIKRDFTPEHTGLDFGAGPGPVITKLLQDAGYNIDLYDPFFWNRPEVLRLKYDYIACCEVIEHFNDPLKDFLLLQSLLKPGGVLYCMTELYSDQVDFKNWHYKNDPTHVFFYHKDAFEWIKGNLHFHKLHISNRLIKLTM
ncbi:MAG: methyltransferase [Firmicutes bacterium HGW-Firmicutes-15]|nr:MAG: methyltransferase [Firmicutes bacterium HGW-Firmicutes-15]